MLAIYLLIHNFFRLFAVSREHPEPIWAVIPTAGGGPATAKPLHSKESNTLHRHWRPSLWQGRFRRGVSHLEQQAAVGILDPLGSVNFGLSGFVMFDEDPDPSSSSPLLWYWYKWILSILHLPNCDKIFCQLPHRTYYTYKIYVNCYVFQRW